MFSSTSAAVAIRTTLVLGAWASLVLGARASQPAAPATKCQPITTQQAFQSWLAWYHLHPKAPADANGPRFRQLLSAADGDLYFLKGLDDGSSQVRELSKQGLIQTLSGRSYVELTERLHDSKAEFRQQAQEILDASPDGHRIAAIVAFVESAKGWKSDGDQAANPPDVDGCEAACARDDYWSPEPAQFGLGFKWRIPFGGLMRMALSGDRSNGQQTVEDFENVIDPEIRGLVIAIHNLEHRPGGDRFLSARSWDDRLSTLRRSLARAERRRSSSKSAAKLLALLGQTIPSSTLDDVTIEQLTQALQQHVDRSSIGADRCGPDLNGEPPHWPAYKLRIELERQVETPHTVFGDFFRPDREPHEPVSWCDDRYRPYPLTLAHGDQCRPHCDPRSVMSHVTPESVVADWIDCPMSEAAAVVPGTYKLLVTFEPSPRAPFGFQVAALRPAIVSAVVFRVQGEAQPTVASVVPSNSLSPSPSTEPGAWQVLQVALSDSTAELDDLCVPAESTLTQPAATSTRADRDQSINFSMSGGSR